MKTFAAYLLALLIFSGCCSLSQNPQESSYYSQQGNLSQGGPISPDTGGSMGNVVINDHTLTAQEKLAFRNFYGVDPQPGYYWYDQESGLYGKIGEPAAGFIYPGHEFGKMRSDASNGDTGVFLNGRELPESEVQFFERLFNAQRQQGYFYLDAYGNTGLVGQPPFANIFSASATTSGSGGYYAGGDTYSGLSYDWGGGGDNFWSGSYGSGNSQGGCSYVNVGGDFATSGCG